MGKKFFKSQWGSLLFAVGNVILSIVNFTKGNEIMGVAWMVTALFWVTIACVHYNKECIAELKERVELLEQKADMYDAMCEEVHTLFERVQLNHSDIDLMKIQVGTIRTLVESGKQAGTKKGD